MRLAAVSLLALAPGALVAQTLPYANMELRTNPALLMNPIVQKDMGVTSAQAGQAMQAMMASGQRLMPLLQKARTDSAAAKKLMVEYRGMETQALKGLTPAQRARLRQITLQTIGPAALVGQSVSQQLGLTAAQRQRISTTVAAEARVAYPKNGTRDMRALMANQDKMRKRLEAKVPTLLTADQRKKWSAMLGKRIDLGPMMGMGNLMPGR